MPYALREALNAFRRTPVLVALSVLAIAVSLFVIGLFGITAFNFQRQLEQIEDRVEVVAYLRDEISPDQLQAAQQEISSLPEVLEVQYVTKIEALATAMRELEDFQAVFADLETNVLPASLEIRLRPGMRNGDVVEGVAQHLLAYPFVEDVRFGREWIDKLVVLRRVFAGVALVIGGAFALVAAIIIGTAIRIAVFARREEIAIMRLVGATHGFVQRPFLLEGLMTGVLGGAIAVFLTYAAYGAVNANFVQVAWLPPSWILSGVVAGAAFGLLSSTVAVRHHLRSV